MIGASPIAIREGVGILIAVPGIDSIYDSGIPAIPGRPQKIF
jgi:hypothetical protein